jgi:phage/plasmid-like protein (TIGR03299 family)
MTTLDAENALYTRAPWHQLGNVGPIDWEEARNAFDWCEVEQTPIFITHEGEKHMLPDRNVIKMVNFPYAHAEVSNRYRIVQHRFMIDDLTGMLLDTDLVETIESVGTYDNGAVGYVSLKFKEGIDIPGWSHVHSMFNIGNGHDKTVPLIATQSAHAVVCANTFKLNILDKEAIFKFKKIGDPQGMMEEAIRALCDGYERNVEYAKTIERMANQKFVDDQWDELIPQLIGPSPMEGPWWNSNTQQSHQGFYNKLTRWQNMRGDLNSRFRRDEDIAGVRNTKWGALMAVQAWEQKDKSFKGLKSQSERNQRHQAAVMFGKLPVTEKAAKILVAN